MSKGGSSTYSQPTYTSGTSNTSSAIPSWLTAASRAGISAATNLLNNPGSAYTGELTAGLTADQTNAGDMIRNSVGAYQPWFDSARSYTNAGTGAGPQITPETYKNGLAGIGDYMNPYIQNVVNSVSEIGQQNLGRALNQTADQALSAGAFGGSRHGVQEGVATAQNNMNTNNLISNLLNQGYSNATNLLGQDISNNMQAQGANQSAYDRYMNRLLSAGTNMANIGTANRAANVADINNLMQYGSLEQNTTGAADTAKYNEFLRMQGLPYNALSAYGSIVGSAPHSTSGTTNTFGWSMAPQPSSSSSPLMSALGLGMTGLSLFNPGTAGISAIGNIAGLLNGGTLK